MMAIIENWWFWASLVVLIVFVEMLLPMGFFLGFALSAALIALALFFFGMALFGGSQILMLVIFAALALAATLLLRFVLQKKNYAVKVWDKDIND